MTQLAWKKYHPLSDQNAFICLVEHMGDDSSIVQAARVSYGKDRQVCPECRTEDGEVELDPPHGWYQCKDPWHKETPAKDRQLIRYLMNHSHTTPFEMVEIKFMVQIPMDHWRQWIRHRTANVNEYSTRYTEALDFFQVTQPTEWRLQATDNKQGSSGYLEEWPEGTTFGKEYTTNDEGLHTEVIVVKLPDGTEVLQHPGEKPGDTLSRLEKTYNKCNTYNYKIRLAAGIAKEQARKDLPLSTYTRAYWKCDLHNIFNFLRLRMHSHAQKEIRSFANCMYEIVKQICPVACEAFEDYVLHAKKFSRMEMQLLQDIVGQLVAYKQLTVGDNNISVNNMLEKPSSMTDREWKEFLEKLQ